MNAPTPSLTLWFFALGLVVALPVAATAQDEKPPQTVEERDLGDGFRAVSVNGGPPAIIDDVTGLILKDIGGRTAVVDPSAGAILFIGDDGEPLVKFYGSKKGGAAEGKKLAPKTLARMKAYMDRVKEYSKDLERGRDARKKTGKTKPSKPKPSLLEQALKLLGVKGEEATALRPMLAAILRKQDEMRRSTLDLARTKPARTSDLPAAVQTFLSAFRKSQTKGTGADTASLSKGLPAYRAARKQQHAELKTLREKLRELLSLAQEAKLAAVGVLD